MNIDPDKLHRYWKNQCSKQEKTLVEQWLKAGEPDQIYRIGNDLDESQLKNELSALISLQIEDKKKHSQRRSPFVYLLNLQKSSLWAAGIAASLLLFAGISVYVSSQISGREKTAMIPNSDYDEIKAQYKAEESAAFDQIKGAAKQGASGTADTELAGKAGFFSYALDNLPSKTTRSVDFYLSPNSSIRGRLYKDTNKGFINVQGSLKVVSKAGENLEMDFGAEHPFFVSRIKVTIQDRQVYHVGVLKEANMPAEILVLSSHELEDVPPRIKIMAFSDYTI